MNTVYKNTSSMIIAIKPTQYVTQYIQFQRPIHNTVMNNGEFVRIVYSTPDMMLTGLHVNIQPMNGHLRTHYDKCKIEYDVSKNIDWVKELAIIESDILNKYKLHTGSSKSPAYNMTYQLYQGAIKIYNVQKNDDKCSTYNVMLKISGVWETDVEYGLTYKLALV
jgi:hypothetical protein